MTAVTMSPLAEQVWFHFCALIESFMEVGNRLLRKECLTSGTTVCANYLS